MTKTTDTGEITRWLNVNLHFDKSLQLKMWQTEWVTLYNKHAYVLVFSLHLFIKKPFFYKRCSHVEKMLSSLAYSLQELINPWKIAVHNSFNSSVRLLPSLYLLKIKQTLTINQGHWNEGQLHITENDFIGGTWAC